MLLSIWSRVIRQSFAFTLQPAYLPIAGYFRTTVIVAKTHVEALMLSLACTGELGTSWGSLGGRCEAIADLLDSRVHSWLDYNPGIFQQLELEIGKFQ